MQIGDKVKIKAFGPKSPVGIVEYVYDDGQLMIVVDGLLTTWRWPHEVIAVEENPLTSP